MDFYTFNNRHSVYRFYQLFPIVQNVLHRPDSSKKKVMAIEKNSNFGFYSPNPRIH